MTLPIKFIDFSSFIDSIKQDLDANNHRNNADKIVELLNKTLDKDKENINEQIKDFENTTTVAKNIESLLNHYKKENKSLTEQLKNVSSDILTNNRKTYYTDQQKSVLTTYYYYLLFIYVAILNYFIIMIFVNGNFHLRILFKILLFVILPFIAKMILKYLYWIASYIIKYIY